MPLLYLGLTMSAVSLLNAKADLSAAEISRSMEGNVCRCGTYARIVGARQKASRVMQEFR